MKKYSGFGRWGPTAGVLAVGMLAFSLSLEGAAPSPQPSILKQKSAPAQDVGEASDSSREVSPVKAGAPDRSGHATSRVSSTSTLPEGIKFGRMPAGDLPVMAPMTVDYRDDSGTRLREQGLLVGPYRPDQGAVAANCSFDIQCDDCNPCTNDVCNISVGAPLGSGTCINAVIANGAEGGCSDGLCCNGRETCQGGVCQAPGAGTGTFDPGACQFPPASKTCVGGSNVGQPCNTDPDCRICVGGTNNGDPCTTNGNCPSGTCGAAGTCNGPAQVCNEDTNLSRLPCTGAGTCSITGGACVSAADCIPPVVANAPEGNYCLNCNDGVNCNGVETCVSGVCESGTNPCGPGATCGEKDCSGAGTTVCTTDSDCAALQLGNCNRPGPICMTGRCCNNSSAEPTCERRKKSGGTCTGGANPGNQCETSAQCDVCAGGVNIGKPCTVTGDCPGSTCNTAGTCNVSISCDAVGGKWYPTDDGDIGPWSNQGTPTICPTPTQTNPANDRTLCPKYSSGLAPLVDFDTETAFVVGFFSQGPCDHDEIGDDYQIENNSPIAMEKFRWIGGGGGRLLVEFYDEFGNFIEDVVTGGIGGGNAVHSLNFLPPLTIPAKGFWVVSVATNFAPNGQTFVTATDAVDEGINKASGAGSLWLDGGPSSISLRECVGGTNDGAWCDPSDPGDSECVNGGGVCQTRNNILAFEIEGIKVAAPTGACCNNGTGTCTAGVLPWVCTGQGNNYQGNDSTCPANCGLGACCATNGTCSVTSSAACTGGAQFQGFGTDCQPNCCTQPVFTGANNCAGVTVQNITVPAPGDDPVVRTITGNNTTASGPDTCLQGAWNAAGGTYLTVDPGWWEAFRINSCAFVRVDFCCSDPVIEPAWALIWDGCPCDDPYFTSVNPNVPGEPANKRGSPYCEDDNLWNKFGPLAGGTCTGGSANGKACTGSNQCPGGGSCTPGHTYYVPVYSVPQGAHGQYQMHITVEACPEAACCNGTTCVETDQLGCANIDGANFLAPPFRTTATTTCTATTCNTGSCCYVPGQGLCQDVISGQLATPTLCNAANGDYKGGARCFGCVCAAGNASCNDDTDCGTNGPCNNPTGGACSGQNLTQTSPCPVCDFESTSRCQKQPGYRSARLSDDCVGDCISDPPDSENSLPTIRVADDFTADVGGNLTGVCVWGIWFNQAGGGDCANTNAPEKFRVKIYNDNNGLPGTVAGASTTTVIRTAETFVSTGGRRVQQWQLALNTSIPLTQGNTYWLEVANNTDESSGLPNCDWMWASSDPGQGADAGNNFVLQDAGNSYTFGDAVFDGADMAWCLSLDNSVPPIRQAACCTCGGGVGSCSVQTLENCTNADGSWQPSEPDCIGVICPNTHGGNDNCPSKQVVASNSATAFQNYCTNTDGPASTDNGDCVAGATEYANDLWFAWTAPLNCDVVFETCDNGGEFDTGMMVYTNNDGTCPCPTSSANELDCSDDGCVFDTYGSRITVPATAGTCYTIRVGGRQGVKGQGVFHVGPCADVTPPQVTPTADPSPFLKPRFISFSVTGGTGETALRIKLTSLHHVSPPYTGGPSIPFTAFEGKALWVGPPSNYIESSASQTPFKASYTQCAPHYRDWNTVGLLHVTGSGIVPSSIYHVENVAASCQGVEGSAACLSGGANVSGQLEIKTTRWGDVADQFNPPSTTAQPDIADVTSMVNKFRSLLGAPIKARVTIAGQDAFGLINVATITNDFNFSHIAACVDAFRGGIYPFKMGKCTGNPTSPSNGSCTTNSDCTGTNGAGPCILDSVGTCTGSPNGVCRWSSQCGGTLGAGPCVINNCAP